jgi:diguanylate cyclase (GGDEF)-like protein/PAS domain S-box-containing protein
MLGRLERQASTDELTGLPNRRTVRAALDAELNDPGEEPVAVVMLDLDHFKTYNDRFGHHGGDRLLKAAAEGWTAQLREPELVGRYGGEEFLVILPRCSLQDAVRTADRLRGALPAGVTCSAGVAVWDGEESDDALIARADNALYEAKRRGRDRTEASGSSAAVIEDADDIAPAGPVGRFVSEGGVRSFLDGISDGFALLDAEGIVREWNRASEGLFGWSREEAMGEELAGLVDAPDIRAAHRNALSAEADGSEPIELVAHGRDGGEIPVEVRFSVVDSEGHAEAVAFIRDISERRATEMRLRRFESIVASSSDAIVSGSLGGRIETWNPAAERLYGYPASEMIGEDISRLKPAGDPAEADAERRRSVRDGRSVRLEGTEMRRDGSLVDVAATISPLRDDDGEVAGFAAVVRDVTERKAAEAQLAAAHSQFAGAFDAAAIGMALVGRDGDFLAVNPALCSLLQRGAEELLATSFQDLTHPDDLEADLERLERVLHGEIDSYRLTKRYLLPDGGIVWGLLTVSVVRDVNGEPLHFVSQIQDIADRVTAEAELERYARQLEALSSQDPLTGLGNRHALISALSEELAVLAAGGRRSSLLLVAVDGDDNEIAAAAHVLGDSAREADLLAHIGGGEFALLLPSVGPDAAERILSRTQDALANHPVRFAVATAGDGDDPGSLLGRAREALSAPPPVPVENGAPQRVRSLLDLARRQLDMPLSFLTRIEGDSYVLERIAGEPVRFGVGEGDVMPFDGSHCIRMLDGRIGSIVHDLAEDPETRDLDVTRNLGLRAYAGVPVRLRSGELYGTLCAVDTAPHPEMSERQAELLRFVSELTAEAIDSAAAEREALDAATSAVGVRALLVALEARDLYTGEHSKEVVRVASGVACRLGLSERAIRDVEQVALLHDVGKVGIPDAVLQKQGPLTDVEWQLMRQHPIVGERIIVGTPGLSHLAPAMRAEHERWDGGGYPDGIAGEEIPMASRITFACDAYHAMTSDRPYRPAMSVEQACAELRANAGTQFDPAVVEALLAEIESQPVPDLGSSSPLQFANPSSGQS